jgi:hypothetical protein
MPMAPEYLEPIGLQAATSILASAELNLPRVKAVPGQRLGDLLRSTSVRSTSSTTSWMIACLLRQALDDRRLRGLPG